MSNYIISPDGKLYHAKNYKYIDREWKNGRWNYTYPEDGQKPKPPLKKKSTERKTVDDEYQKELAYNSQKNVYPSNNAKSDSSTKKTETSSKTSTATPKPIDDEYQKNLDYNSGKKVDSKTKSSTSTATPKPIDDEYQKNLEVNSKKNEYPSNTAEMGSSKKPTKTTDEIMTDLRDTHRRARQTVGTESWGAYEVQRNLDDDKLWMSFAEEDLRSMIKVLNETNIDDLPRDKRKYAKAIIEDADKILSEWKRLYPDSPVSKEISARQKNVSENASAVDKVKDKLGFDEWDDYKLASRNLELAKARLDHAQYAVDRLNSEEDKKYWTTKGRSIVNYYSDMHNDAKAEVHEATKNANDAKNKSDKTVVGAVHNVVDSGKEFVENIFSNKKKKKKKR